MEKFTDIFIQRPVLATVISLLILLLGIRSLLTLQVRQYPKLENTVITVTTPYVGAPSELVQGFITTPLERKIAGAEGIDYMTSESRDGVSIIQVYLELNFDPDSGFTNVLSKVQEALRELPREAEQPTLQKVQGTGFALMYVGFTSKTLSLEQITDYIIRVVQPKLSTVNGIAEASLLSNKTFAMRIWLNSERMAGVGVSATDVFNAIDQKNIQAAAGDTESKFIQVSIKPDTDLKTPEEFSQMIVKTGKDGSLVRLKDIGVVELGSESYDTDINFNNERAVFIAVTVTPKANPLEVIAAAKKELNEIKQDLPEQLSLKVVYDATQYIQESINEVVKTIAEATLIVIIVIFLFLGTVRSVTIPIVAIPLSLIGVATVLFFMGYSINLLTLLALVLAIGMVVDDAIVVVENIYRHIEEGQTPKSAAIQGAREIAMPIVAMTITLAAVYSPIIFMGGITGALFKEFAFTLACAVIISGIIALTLSPMMCSKVLNEDIARHKLVAFVEHEFARLSNFYSRVLTDMIENKAAVLLFAFVVLLSCLFLYINSKKELAPEEDQGIVFAMGLGPQTATLDYMLHYANQLPPIFDKIEAKEDYFIVSGSSAGTPVTNQGIYGVILKPWSQRTQSQKQVQQFMQKEMNKIPGLQFQVFPIPAIPTGGLGIPIQFEIISTLPLEQIYPYAQQVIGKGMQTGQFVFLTTNLKFDKPELEVNIDRSKAAQLGVGIDTISNALATAYGENYINWFDMENRNYQVIPQMSQPYRYNKNSIDHLYVQTTSGNFIPLSTMISTTQNILPNNLSRFQQLNSVEIVGVVNSKFTLGEALDSLKNIADQTLPRGINYDYAGESRQYIEEGGGLILTFFFALIIIYLVLAAQFENFRDPLVILISVPMAISGALIAIDLGIGGVTINIYTQVGLITLIGLISKHGILIVEFANQIKRSTNVNAQKAVIEAAKIRLRPVLMTSFSMIFGVVPLLLATGAGAVSRFNIGLVIATGMLIGTLFTLFVVPTIYTLKTKHILAFITSAILTGIGLYFLIY